ncbi:1-aminocyclopropane-1-carboxylate oxidase homolog 1 [Linum perenne]
MAELKAFDATKAGVRGLVDSGVKEVPRIFHAPPHFMDNGPAFSPDDPNFKFPIIDLAMVHDPIKRKETVDQIRNAAESWGFFLIVNHGVPDKIQKEMKTGIKEFFELDVEQKKRFYDLQQTKEILPKYTAEMTKIGDLLFQLLSEGLGLETNHLKDMGCLETIGYAFHYYAPCPQPELTLGCVHHTDIDFITVISQDQVGGFLQDQIGGLQVFRRGSWIDVPFVPGAMVVNIGDLLQLISNDRFTSALHRVKSKKTGPRISIPAFFGHGTTKSTRKYGPIKEMLSDNDPPKYKETTIRDFFLKSYKKGANEFSILPQLKIDNSAAAAASV